MPRQVGVDCKAVFVLCEILRKKYPNDIDELEAGVKAVVGNTVAVRTLGALLRGATTPTTISGVVPRTTADAAVTPAANAPQAAAAHSGDDPWDSVDDEDSSPAASATPPIPVVPERACGPITAAILAQDPREAAIYARLKELTVEWQRMTFDSEDLTDRYYPFPRNPVFDLPGGERIVTLCARRTWHLGRKIGIGVAVDDEILRPDDSRQLRYANGHLMTHSSGQRHDVERIWTKALPYVEGMLLSWHLECDGRTLPNVGKKYAVLTSGQMLTLSHQEWLARLRPMNGAAATSAAH
jgi:hypothetical protein